MNNLRLLPEIHRQQEIIKASFAYDQELITLIKSQKGARWSQTLQSWYFSKKDFQLNTLYQALKGKVYLDYSKINTNTPTPKNLISKPPKNTVALPKAYIEQLILKRYTHVSKRKLKRIESPIDRILKNQNPDNHHIINKRKTIKEIYRNQF